MTNFSRTLVFTTMVLSLFLAGCSREKETEWGIYNEPIESVDLPESAGLDELAVAWERDIGDTGDNGYAILRPAIGAGGVFVSNRDGTVRRLDSTDGKVVWQTRLKKKVLTGTGLGQGLVLVALDTGVVIGLDSENGEEQWRSPVNRQVSAIPAAGSGRVVVRSADGMLIGLEASSGEEVWSLQRAAPGLSVHGDSIPLISGDVVITGLSNGKLIANSVVNGREFWETDLSFVRGSNELERLSDVDTPPIVINNSLYAATYQGDVVSVDLQTSSVKWRQDISTRLPLSESEGTLFVVDELGGVHALTAESGEVRWNESGYQGRGISNPLGIDADLVNGRSGRLVIGDADGNLHLLDSDSGALLETRRVSRGAIISLAHTADGFVAFSSRGGVIAMRLKAD